MLVYTVTDTLAAAAGGIMDPQTMMSMMLAAGNPAAARMLNPGARLMSEQQRLFSSTTSAASPQPGTQLLGRSPDEMKMWTMKQAELASSAAATAAAHTSQQRPGSSDTHSLIRLSSAQSSIRWSAITPCAYDTYLAWSLNIPVVALLYVIYKA